MIKVINNLFIYLFVYIFIYNCGCTMIGISAHLGRILQRGMGSWFISEGRWCFLCMK